MEIQGLYIQTGAKITTESRQPRASSVGLILHTEVKAGIIFSKAFFRGQYF